MCRFVACVKHEAFPSTITDAGSGSMSEDERKSYVSVTDSQSLKVIEPSDDETDGGAGKELNSV